MGTYDIPYQNLSLSIPDDGQVFRAMGGVAGENNPIYKRVGNQILQIGASAGSATSGGKTAGTRYEDVYGAGSYASIAQYNMADVDTAFTQLGIKYSPTDDINLFLPGGPVTSSGTTTQTISPTNPNGIVVTGPQGQVVTQSPVAPTAPVPASGTGSIPQYAAQTTNQGAVTPANTPSGIPTGAPAIQPGQVPVPQQGGAMQTFTTPSGAQVQAPGPTIAPPASGTAAPAGTPAPTGAMFGPNGYSGISIVDYLNAAGQPSDKASRARLAQQFGVQNYDYSAAKNTELLEKLRASGGGAGASSAGTGQPTGQTGNPQTGTPQTGAPQVPTTNNGKTPYENVIETYSKVYGELGLGSIKTAYEKTINDQKALQDKLDDEVSDINDNPWLSEGIRVKQIERAQGRYETRLNTLSNYAKLYDSLYQEGRQTAQFLVGQAQTDTRFAIEQAQKKQDALDKLTNQDHEFVEANGRKYLVDKKTGTIIADLGISSRGTVSTGAGANIKSGTLVYSGADQASDSRALDGSRGTDGYVDPSLYQKLYNAWLSSGGRLEDFIKTYPPKNYVNPANTWLPKYLMPTTSSLEAQINSLF